MSTPALLVVADDDALTHLVVGSPAIPGARPDDRDILCGAPFAQDKPAATVADVDCGDCLILSLPYWDLPSWADQVQLP